MSRIRVPLVTALALLAVTSMHYAMAADAPATDTAAVTDSSKLKSGLTPLAHLLELMDTDKNGKVSKQEFMTFMESEFDFADKNKDAELDPTELKRLVQQLNHPRNGMVGVRK
jgi:hypothetical protein